MTWPSRGSCTGTAEGARAVNSAVNYSAASTGAGARGTGGMPIASGVITGPSQRQRGVTEDLPRGPNTPAPFTVDDALPGVPQHHGERTIGQVDGQFGQHGPGRPGQLAVLASGWLLHWKAVGSKACFENVLSWRRHPVSATGQVTLHFGRSRLGPCGPQFENCHCSPVSADFVASIPVIWPRSRPLQ